MSSSSKKAIVTGASRGIGYQICCSLAEQNIDCVAVARSEQKLSKLRQRHPSHIYPHAADLRDDEAINDLTQHLKEHFGFIDILINNAGALIKKPFAELGMKDWNSQIESNLFIAVRMIKKLLPFFSDEAHIVNISSMGGFQGSKKFAGLSAYSISKGTLCSLTECLAVELADQNISINALCLGAVHTKMFQKAFDGLQAPVTPEKMGDYIAGFAQEGHHFYNGKILPVALEDPD